ncbi:MAG TPA: hypothetical protein PJ988_01285, partial [Anaerolinea sp.]|nr:hypothetical protein [Anaerolinea sp.]
MLSITDRRLTIGVLTGWQVYAGTLHNFLDYVFRGIKAAAHDLNCNLMIGCGVGRPFPSGPGRPAIPFSAPYGDFIPVGPWNSDGLIVVTPLGFYREHEADYFDQLVREGYPLVYAGVARPGPVVEVDNRAGILQAVKHLAQHGHRR